MCAIAANALYTTWRKRGTTRQLAFVIVSCVLSALLLLPAIIWYNARLSASPASIGMIEATVALIYVALWGCVVPLGVTTWYCLYTSPRDSHTSARMPRSRSKRTTKGNAASITTVRPPRRQPGVPAPFVYSNDVPWGWLEHRAGRFQGQRLALKRAIISIGREEDNEIWLDDETSSRYHAEIAWQEGQTYVTDCDSLNGIILNGRRMRGSLPINSGDLLEIGSHRFLFEIAPRPTSLRDEDDPLFARRPSISLDNLVDNGALDQAGEQVFTRKAAGSASPPTRPLNEPLFADSASSDERDPLAAASQSAPGIGDRTSDGMPSWMLALRSDPVTPQPLPPLRSSMCLIHSGSLAGRSFLLDRPTLIVGRSPDCDVLLDDTSISTEYARFTRQPEGDYVSGVGAQVNGELLRAAHLLQQGDTIDLGATRLEYMLVPDAHTTPLPQLSVPPIARPISGPVPFLRLPSKPK
ncbi:MAG TPA: FHA domain-containing protein [Ktedonobacteraceae bacterium]|nr:FHA domain-containing protein [Ktedonobacteraceae bacterium]